MHCNVTILHVAQDNVCKNQIFLNTPFYSSMFDVIALNIT